MNQYLPFIVVGLATGSLYSLAGLGLVLTYRTSGVFNFGHGAIAAGAAFMFYSLHTTHGMSWELAAVLTLVAFAVVAGMLLELIARTLADVPAAVTVLVTIGIFLAVDGFLLVKFGDITRQSPQFLPTSGFVVSNVNISWAEIIGAAIALGAAVGLSIFLKSTRLGTSMRAVIDNPTLLGLSGQYPARVRRASWMIGAGFAAISGILLAPTLSLDATLLTMLVVQAFGACAIGLFRSLPLTYVGGLVVGVLSALATKVFTTFPLNQSPNAIPFIVLIVILLVVPLRKLPGGRATVRSLASTAPSLSSRNARILAVVLAAALLLVPAFAGSHLPLWITAMSFVVLFGSLSLLIWSSGQISLCQISFAALGATTMAHLTHSGVPWLIALLLSGLLTMPVGTLIAIPAIRFSGIYLALITFGFGILMEFVLYPSWLMFGNDLSAQASRPHFAFISADSSDKWQYYVALTVAAVSVLVLIQVHRSRFGRLLRGLAESPTMLSTLGLDVNVTRLALFSISAFFAGIAGALMSSQYSVSSLSFNPVLSLVIVAVLGICGLLGGRLVLTAVVASFLYAILPGEVSGFDTDHQTLYFGITAIIAGLVIANRASLTAWISQHSKSSGSRLAHSPVADRALAPPRSRATTQGRRR